MDGVDVYNNEVIEIFQLGLVVLVGGSGGPQDYINSPSPIPTLDWDFLGLDWDWI